MNMKEIEFEFYSWRGLSAASASVVAWQWIGVVYSFFFLSFVQFYILLYSSFSSFSSVHTHWRSITIHIYYAHCFNSLNNLLYIFILYSLPPTSCKTLSLLNYFYFLSLNSDSITTFITT